VIFGRRKGGDDGTAIAEPSAASPEIDAARQLVDAGNHFGAIDYLNAANRRSRSTAIEVELRRIRNLAGMSLLEDPPSDPQHPDAGTAPSPDPESRLPEITPSELTPELLRAAMLSSGAL
jgi:hypothetical protein